MESVGSSAAIAGLVERDRYLTQLDASLAADAGRLVLVAGEAGVGKTALVGAFCAGLDPRTRVLSGACDGMRTPRALGPLVDIAAQTGGELGEAVETKQPAGCFAALADELDDARPTVVVIEDIQWADEATLDVLLMLGRRAERVRALVIVTYRDDELTADHPLRRVIGDLGRHGGVDRISLPRLSPEAVGVLAEPSGVDAVALYATTGGNSFFVTEVLEAGGGVIPETARDAVLARAAHASAGARRVLDAVAVRATRCAACPAASRRTAATRSARSG
jgi:predicted ATPase